ncbi:Vacuolar protein sorting-associated protein 29 [Elasticomyces elasticus]|nr:Vacuolar protein sorting-associated protein 29 [Elasticomyces elasticus]
MASRLVLVLGDLFIPDRAINTADAIAQFKKLLTPGKIAQILCLGNLTSPSAYQFLKHLAPDLQLVKGDFDIPLTNPSQSQTQSQTSQQTPQNATAAEASTFPIPTALSKVVTHGSLRIGFTHGDSILPPGDPDALLIAARQMDVDVLCWGGTCRFEAYEMEGKFFINPGSATGAVSWLDETLGEDGENGGGEAGDYGSVPSFVLMDVQGDVLVLYVYQLRVDGEGKETVGVEKVSFRKEASAVA